MLFQYQLVYFLICISLVAFSQEPLHGSRLILILPFLLLLLMTSIRGKHSARGARHRRREGSSYSMEKFMKGNLSATDPSGGFI